MGGGGIRDVGRLGGEGYLGRVAEGVIRDVRLGVGVGGTTDVGVGGGETGLGIRAQVHFSVGTAPELCKTARKECWALRPRKEEALDGLPSKDERGPSSVRRTLEPFERQRWGNF